MKALFLAVVGSFVLISNVFAQTPDDSESGLALPRMVSLRSNLINARSGPGARYPIEWVYRDGSAPVEIIAEFELWRKIKDWEGSESWVHKSMLSGNRNIKMTAKGESNIYNSPDYNSRIIAKVEDGVVGVIKKCPSDADFCLIKFQQIIGWVPRQNFFGTYPREVIN